MNIIHKNNINIVIDNDSEKKYEKSILLIQKFVRRKYCMNKFNKFREKIKNVIHNKDTTRINSSKFNLSQSLVKVLVSEGSTEEYCGIRLTSSNVSESLILPIFNYIYFLQISIRKILIELSWIELL